MPWVTVPIQCSAFGPTGGFARGPKGHLLAFHGSEGHGRPVDNPHHGAAEYRARHSGQGRPSYRASDAGGTSIEDRSRHGWKVFHRVIHRCGKDSVRESLAHRHLVGKVTPTRLPGRRQASRSRGDVRTHPQAPHAEVADSSVPIRELQWTKTPRQRQAIRRLAASDALAVPGAERCVSDGWMSRAGHEGSRGHSPGCSGQDATGGGPEGGQRPGQRVAQTGRLCVHPRSRVRRRSALRQTRSPKGRGVARGRGKSGRPHHSFPGRSGAGAHGADVAGQRACRRRSDRARARWRVSRGHGNEWSRVPYGGRDGRGTPRVAEGPKHVPRRRFPPRSRSAGRATSTAQLMRIIGRCRPYIDGLGHAERPRTRRSDRAGPSFWVDRCPDLQGRRARRELGAERDVAQVEARLRGREAEGTGRAAKAPPAHDGLSDDLDIPIGRHTGE